jgi:hypothetical protein
LRNKNQNKKKDKTENLDKLKNQRKLKDKKLFKNLLKKKLKLKQPKLKSPRKQINQLKNEMRYLYLNVKNIRI